MPFEMYYTKFPAFNLKITVQGNMITKVDFLLKDTILRNEQPEKSALTEQINFELDQYLINPLHKFNLPLVIGGTPFQKLVWNLMLQIEPGKPWSYKEMATKLDSAPRAIGGACGRNPIPIFIPCHRVIGSNKKLCGFVQGNDPRYMAIKQWLLAHETQKI